MRNLITIDVFGSFSYIETAPLFTLNDSIGVGLCILALLITYFWRKKIKNQESEETANTVQRVRPIPVRTAEHDIFGLPKRNQQKRNTQEDIPFTNFSLKQAYWILALLIIMSIVISMFRQYS